MEAGKTEVAVQAGAAYFVRCSRVIAGARDRLLKQCFVALLSVSTFISTAPAPYALLRRRTGVRAAVHRRKDVASLRAAVLLRMNRVPV